MLAALSLAESEEKGDTKTSRRRAIKAAVAEVAEYLGNTPTIAKNSYVDPRVLDKYESGQTIDLGAAAVPQPRAAAGGGGEGAARPAHRLSRPVPRARVAPTRPP